MTATGHARWRILVLAPHPFFQDRGTPIAVRMLAETLADEGHAVDVLTYHEGTDLGHDRVRVLRIPAIPGVRGIRPGFSWKKVACDLVMAGTLARLLRRERYDVLHATEEAVYLALAAKRLFGIPFVYDMDSSLPRQMADKFAALRPLLPAMEWCEAVAVRGSQGVLAVCDALRETALRYAPDKTVARLEDVSLLDGAPASGLNLRSQFGVVGPLVLYVGNLESYQGIDLLLEGFAAADVPDAHLAIVGGADGDIQKYQEKAGSLRIAERVHFAGPRPVTELGYYLGQADVLVSPRTQGENTPMKIYSYLDSGRPVLATKLRTHTQVLDDDIAVLVSPEPRALARGLERLLSDAELRCTLGERARLRVEEEYSLQAFRRKLVAFYGGLHLQGAPS